MRGFGFPLYVNGQLFQQPVTISHVPGANAQGVLRGIGIDPSMGALGAYASYRPTRGMPRGYGDDGTTPATTPVQAALPPSASAQAALVPPPPPVPPMFSERTLFLAAAIDFLSTAGLAYHGYKRNDSIGWALVWAIFGGAVPIIGWPVAIAQGFGEPRRGLTPNRRRRHRRNGRLQHELKLKDKASGQYIYLTIRDGRVVGAMGSDPKRYIGLSETAAKHKARYAQRNGRTRRSRRRR